MNCECRYKCTVGGQSPCEFYVGVVGYPHTCNCLDLASGDCGSTAARDAAWRRDQMSRASTRAKNPDDIFTAPQVAKICSVDLKTIHNWVKRGAITHFRTPGHHLRFRRQDILEFLEKFGYPVPDGFAPRDKE